MKEITGIFPWPTSATEPPAEKGTEVFELAPDLTQVSCHNQLAAALGDHEYKNCLEADYKKQAQTQGKEDFKSMGENKHQGADLSLGRDHCALYTT